jgi:hypothetical protein
MRRVSVRLWIITVAPVVASIVQLRVGAVSLAWGQPVASAPSAPVASA